MSIEAIRALLADTLRFGNDPVTPEATFQRPADTTQYASGDLVANSTTNTLVAPMLFALGRQPGNSFIIRRVRLRASNTTLTLASFRVHLYTTPMLQASTGDNAAWSTDQVANYLGAFDVTFTQAFTDGASGYGIPNIGNELTVKLATGQINIYALLEARAAYTPTSGQTFSLQIEAWRN